MLKYDRIDIDEGIDIKKCKETSRDCNLCKFYYFLDKNFNYEQYLCNGCYDMSLKAISMQNFDQNQSFKLLLIIMKMLIVLISNL